MSTPVELIEELQCRYVRALDGKRLDSWLGLFARDGQYFVIPADNEAAGLPLALMMDDCYERLEDRVNYVNKVWTFDDYQTRHFVQRLHVEQTGDGLYAVESNVAIFMSDSEGKIQPLAMGRYDDRVRIDGDGSALFRSKRVIVDSFCFPSNIVYPL
jgi:anthranilate 1,2-dioxygenase small subunit